jgi:hypothetical protein
MVKTKKDVIELANKASDRAARLQKIAKSLDVIKKQRNALDVQEANLIAEAKDFSTKKPAQRRPVVKKATPSKKAARATSKTGETLPQILLRIVPGSKEEAVNKDELAARVAAEGYKSASGDPKVVIGQTLGKSDLFKSPARGLWQRSPKGDKVFAEVV